MVVIGLTVQGAAGFSVAAGGWALNVAMIGLWSLISLFLRDVPLPWQLLSSA